nr:DPP IV N-terminal domain-containing protein [Ferruginibacter sp.]
MKLRIIKIILVVLFISQAGLAQRGRINWTEDGNAYTKIKDGGIVKVDPKTEAEVVLVRQEQLTPSGGSKALVPQSYAFNNNNTKLLIFTNTARVWRYNTRGDYWILDIIANKLKQLGKGLPAQSLMFAKFSPDGRRVAYVSEHNLYVEEISTG